MSSSDRKISIGTLVMLFVTLLVMIGSAMVLFRLFSGHQMDISRIGKETINVKKTMSGSLNSGGLESNRKSRREQSSQYYEQREDNNSQLSANAGGRFSLTAAGTSALEETIRKSGYLSDVKVYDLTEIMSLLKNELNSDINLIFLENVLTDDAKPSDIIAPSATAAMLKEAGFNMAACGFQGAWNKKSQGIADTRRFLNDAGITPLGIYSQDGTDRIQIMNCGGIPTAFLQYTGTISQSERKKMIREGQSEAVPPAEADIISADITEARLRGADLVIVLMNWGSRGKAPDKNMKKLAQQIADAGADLIIGSGSRKPQQAEYLEALRADGTHAQVLCVWSLGLTLSKDRRNAQNMAGYLFHVEFIMDSARNVRMEYPAYTPLYTWLYTQDRRDNFRVLAANRIPPDGMDIKQQNTMSRVADITREALKDSPLTER